MYPDFNVLKISNLICYSVLRTIKYEVWPKMSPKKMYSDFEEAFGIAASEVFPGIEIIDCYFYYCQVRIIQIIDTNMYSTQILFISIKISLILGFNEKCSHKGCCCQNEFKK